MYHCIFPHLVQTPASTLGVAELCIFQNLLGGFPSKFKQMPNIERAAAPSKLSRSQQTTTGREERRRCFTTPSDDRTCREGACDRGTDASSSHGWREKGREREKKDGTWKQMAVM